VAPVGKIKVGAGEPVEIQQQVAVERRGDAERIVVGRFQDFGFLDQVNADQQRPAVTLGVRLAQEGQRRCGREIADAGTG
jgi:hypothetical protein